MNNIELFFDKCAKTWDELDKHTYAEKYSLLKHINLKKNDLVLDVACGTGTITPIIHDFTNENVDAIDLSNEMIKIAKTKFKDNQFLNFIHGDLYCLSSINKYDAIIIYNAFPHFLDIEKLINKTYSLLKENGKLAILHSLSRKQLSLHHSGKEVSKISRDLLDPTSEGKRFKPKFSIEEAYEDDNSFILILNKN